MGISAVAGFRGRVTVKNKPATDEGPGRGTGVTETAIGGSGTGRLSGLRWGGT